MAANYSGLIALLASSIETVWPEAHANGIYYTLASLSAKATANQLPFVLLDIDLDPDPGLLEDERGPVLIFYVMRRETDDVMTFNALLERLQALQEALDNQPMLTGSGSIVGRPKISASRRLDLNLAFEETGQPFWVGLVRPAVQV